MAFLSTILFNRPSFYTLKGCGNVFCSYSNNLVREYVTKKRFLNLNSVMIQEKIGHCPKNIHEVRLKTVPDVKWQNCMVEGEMETSRHFFLHFLAFARLRLQHQCRHTFGEPGELAEIDIFATDSRRFSIYEGAVDQKKNDNITKDCRSPLSKWNPS